MTTLVLPEIIGLNAEETALAEASICDMCYGSGVYFIPAKVEAGIIVDEKEIKCPCSYKDQNDYEPDIF